FTVRHRLRCSVFPYTTLFRSVVGVVAIAGEGGVRVGGDERRGDLPPDLVIVEAAEEPGAPRVGRLHLEAAIELDGVPDDLVRHQDRKSTRLNSSHEWISYAVF